MPAITGKYLYDYFRNKVQETYTTYTGGTVRANKLFLDAFLAVFEERFKGIGSQKYRDDVGFLVQSQIPYNLNNNRLYTAPLVVSTFVNIGVNVTMTTALPHNLHPLDFFTLSHVQGFVAAPVGPYQVVTTPDTNTITFVLTGVLTGTYVNNSGNLSAFKSIPDYWQMISVRARYDVLYNTTITRATGGTPIIITIDKRTDIRSFQLNNVAGVQGEPDANGDRYFKYLNDFQFALYTDPLMLTPTVGTGNYQGGGNIYRIYNNVCKPWLPRTKISPLANPTVQEPRYENAQKFLKFYPDDRTCQGITLDYYKRPDVVVDVSDDVLDLTDYYSEKLLHHLADVAAIIFSQPARDVLLYEESQNMASQNN